MSLGSMREMTTSNREPQKPILDLSGPKLRAAFEALVRASETIGGVERYAEALKLKSQVFQERLAEGRAQTLERPDFEEMVLLMPTVRRRIGKPLADLGWPMMRNAIATLLTDAHVPGTGDQRMAAFCQSFPLTKDFRFTRDFAAEILHSTLPEHYPLMTRWVWDSKANSGALREIWHGDDVDHMLIDVPDNHEVFLVLREELSQFLSSNGIFRDMMWYVDLLVAQVYGDYVNAQGGAYLKTEFGSDSDPLEHSRRILGVDARIAKRSGNVIDATAETSNAIKRIN